MNMDSSISLKTKGRQTDTIVVIGGTVSCHVTTYGATSDDNVVFLYEHNVRSTTPVQYNPLGIINQLDNSIFHQIWTYTDPSFPSRILQRLNEYYPIHY